MPKRKSSKLPLISIVIPSYNKVDFIGETLKSIVKQKYSNLEVIIQDGGSTDGTLRVIKAYATKYPDKIVWESRKDKGQVAAINKGLRKATGEIVTYLNADDLLKPKSLKEVGDYFRQNTNELWLAGKGDVIDKKGKNISSLVTSYKNFLLSINSYYALLIVNYLTQPAVFLRKSTFEKYGPFKGSKTAILEYDLWLKIGKVSMPSVLDQTLASFRLTKGNLSSNNFSEILSSDYEIAKGYTNDSVLLFFHWLHNVGRVIVLYALRLK